MYETIFSRASSTLQSTSYEATSAVGHRRFSFFIRRSVTAATAAATSAFLPVCPGRAGLLISLLIPATPLSHQGILHTLHFIYQEMIRLSEMQIDTYPV